ncbi:transcriptional regulator, AraC family protein [Reinekea sp. MED297]|uniref:Transcriptional regulator, AraC family protein n=1 Tax=Reinekea blandensis MED297 TaxID=314283 RepID=A4BA20_9GAMM|nr:transcriptional regulator, AraC family protein [Reinekea sp. MED297] [Reinekea blandensis MED297]
MSTNDQVSSLTAGKLLSTLKRIQPLNLNDRLQDVLANIESSLEEDLSVDQLAQLTHVSRFHFHRLFSATFGLGVMTLIRRLRLKRAAFRLAYRAGDSITNIGYDCGYDSPEAFNRAFRKHFGLAPSDFRRSPDFSVWAQHYDPIQTLRNQHMPAPLPDVTVIEMPAIPLAVMPHRGNPARLSHTLQAFIAWRKRNGLSPSHSRTFNLVYDDPNEVTDDDYRFDLACEIQGELPADFEGMESRTIPAGRYARARLQGSDDALERLVHSLYAEWLPSSGYDLADFPLLFERVRFFPDVSEHEMITDVYLPLASER